MLDIHVHTINVELNEIPPGLTWYIIGQPKTGKTTQTSQWHEDGASKVLLIDTDLGSDFANSANVATAISLYPPQRKVTKDGKIILGPDKQPLKEIIPPIERGYSYRTGPNKGKPMEVYSFYEIVKWLKKDWGKLPYETIVIDTIDEVNEWIEEIVEAELQIGQMGQGEWGADWRMARRKNLDIVKQLQSMIKKAGGTLVLTSHAKQSSISDNKVQLSPELPRGLGKALAAKADIIGYTSIDKSTNQYMISFVGYDERTVGSRIQALSQQKLPFDYQAITKFVSQFKQD